VRCSSTSFIDFSARRWHKPQSIYAVARGMLDALPSIEHTATRWLYKVYCLVTGTRMRLACPEPYTQQRGGES